MHRRHTHHALVRPYMLTRGRTSSSLGVFELHAPALALDHARAARSRRHARGPPHRRALPDADVGGRALGPRSARRSVSLRVLVGDLVVAHMLHVRQSEDQAEHRDVRLLERLLEGIRAI